MARWRSFTAHLSQHLANTREFTHFAVKSWKLFRLWLTLWGHIIRRVARAVTCRLTVLPAQGSVDCLEVVFFYMYAHTAKLNHEPKYDGMMSLARRHQGVAAPLHVAHGVGRP